MNLIDEAKIYLESGKGGNGCVSFRREKFVQFGGPDGGHGGRGGNIILVSDSHLTTLMDFRYNQHFRAEAGESGKGGCCIGKSGADLYLRVPVGTQVYSEDQRAMLYDFTKEGQTFVILQGGRGGAGNTSFKSSKQRAPRQATKGEPGEEITIWLKLKLLSDVGIIGLPNAGKSTLLSKVTNAKPNIADYPFTTLRPNLGIARVGDQDLVIADIPGLISGAHLGLGLGHKFLKHIERCKSILHLIDVNSTDLIADYDTIRHELHSYSPVLAIKPEIVCLSKCESIQGEEVLSKKQLLEGHIKQPVYLLSAYTGEGLSELVSMMLSNMANTGSSED